MKKRMVLSVDSRFDDLNQKLLTELLLKIMHLEKQNLRQKKSKAEMVKTIKKIVEERVRCVC